METNQKQIAPNSVRIWLDDERAAPDGYVHCHSVNEAINQIEFYEQKRVTIELLDLDHDLGDYAKDGGDAIKLIDWLCERNTFYKIVLHTANPVGRANMMRTINRYWPDKD
ncbi:hypothetical protein SAMN02910357_00142 [Succinivibrio dextrinosolvens]|uniref:cyclic-phosphate processing receiver domain-containing protein n=1 Tax=Succinivibrio dextrinosolvens TaxID=83771 RepID=UPI0008E99513|nr:cyclic-phosphate processing receiver domain-containing protein [Succinivibrio dextrinosolvens]SFS32569.1 hypothetical protein SAMN02910357_00142 [Succinivibrio dextrinosolvens]